MNELLLSLVIWITQNTAFDYDTSQSMPVVESIPGRQLAGIYYGQTSPTGLSRDHLASLEESIEAIYVPETKTILVAQRIDLSSPYGRSVLVHELIHFLQYEHAIDEQVGCVSALERDAYHAQARFLESRSLTLDVDAFTIGMRSLCAVEAGFSNDSGLDW